MLRSRLTQSAVFATSRIPLSTPHHMGRTPAHLVMAFSTLSSSLSSSSSSSSLTRQSFRHADPSMALIRPLFMSTATATAVVPDDDRAAAHETVEEVAAAAAAADAPFVPTPDRKYKYMMVNHMDNGVTVITFDCPGKSVNTLSFDFSNEAKEMWKEEIENNPSVKALVFTSAKKDMFIAGADIQDIKRTRNRDQLIAIIQDSVDWFKRVRAKKIPTVVAIDGVCMGGGLEWALWSDYRICTDNPKTRLSLPEVKLGLLPGFGGTQNLPRLIGIQSAMDMMLTGKDIRPDKAKKMGLVDLVVAPASLESVAIKTAKGMADGTFKKPKRKPKSWINWMLEDTPIGRAVLFRQIKQMVDKNTDGHYPAPYKILQCVEYGITKDLDEGLKNEREQFATLAATPESQALIGIFEGMTALKKHPYGPNAAVPVHKVAVIGAGLMGAGIVQVTAEKAVADTILLKDRNDAALGRGLSYMQDDWNKKVSRKHMTQYQCNQNVSRVTPITEELPVWEKHFASVDLVIEAVFEDLSLKKQVVIDVERLTADHCIFASNTSAIPIAEIAHGAKRPQNIIGMHYFSPVPKMPLLEIIPHSGSSEAAIATALEVGTKQGKTCIVVKDVPGFYVNRSLGPYLVEVAALIKDGAELEQMDKAMKRFGMPVGPITLLDEVGLDVAVHVSNFLSKADLGQRMGGNDTTIMEEMIRKGYLGKKSGMGFYDYSNKKQKKVNAQVAKAIQDHVKHGRKVSDVEIQERLVTRFVNEAAKCLEDEIIATPTVGDIGLVFGTGFAPFRGGPFRYLDQYGTAPFVDLMRRYAAKHGPQFEPCQLLQDYATSGKKFHPV